MVEITPSQDEDSYLHFEPGDRQTFQQAVRDCCRQWAKSFNLEKEMANCAENGSFDSDEVNAFIEIITRDNEVIF